jgi:ubiquinone/menaquinone biosynthesis C-methylase UbiE
VIREYFNSKADTWDETVTEKDTFKLQHMARRLGLAPCFTVLDVGTGTGVFLPYILGEIREAGRLVALDLADEMLLRAKAKSPAGDIEYLCADIMAIPLCDGIFDAVVCYSSFPHLQDKPKALAEIKRVLKISGRLFICHTSSRAEINQIHSQIPVVQNDLIPEAEEMKSMLFVAGFRQIEISEGSSSYLCFAVKPGLS